MASSTGSGPAFRPSEWQSASRVYTRSQLMAFLRAGIIALILLGVILGLALLVALLLRSSRCRPKDSKEALGLAVSDD